MMVTAHYVTEEFRLMMEDIKKGDFSRMERNHHILSGFKGNFTDDMYRNVDIARRSTGGAGFTNASGFTELFRNAAPMPTYEGDNTVMLGQASRYLVKLVAKANKKASLPFPFTYLNNMQKTLQLKNQARTKEDFLDLDILDLALQVKACHLINSTLQAFNANSENSKKKDNEIFQQAKLVMVKAHMKYIQFTVFRHMIDS